MAENRFEDDDPILPVRITHECERIWNGNSLEQEYNYLVYEFDTELHSYWARSYLDDINKVSIYGPFRSNKREPALGKQEIDERIVAYFRRRYRKLQGLGSNGYIVIK